MMWGKDRGREREKNESSLMFHSRPSTYCGINSE